jgi:hypothetical protein
MKLYIVLIPIEGNPDARAQCELIENTKFVTLNPTCIKLKHKIITLISDDTYELSGLQVWAMSDFMDYSNNEEYNPDGYFMSYVYS